MEETTIKLTKPLSFGKDTYTELKLKEPKGKHLRALKEGMEFGDLLDIGAKLAGVPVVVVNELPAKDALQVVEAVKDFLVDGP